MSPHLNEEMDRYVVVSRLVLVYTHFYRDAGWAQVLSRSESSY